MRRFLSAIAGVRLCVVEFERTCLLCDEMIDFMLGIQEYAQFRCMSVENLVERMVLWKAFVDDVQ